MEVCGQLHSPAALGLRKALPVPIAQVVVPKAKKLLICYESQANMGVCYRYPKKSYRK
jgi:hypothetical protein